ncbi:MAG TPA: CDP-glycerol glycerophosphotransferase family protein, partial [Candidatus Limnocylindrales bacterium]|nr:CDP-glycerol glycerophosphotransferase family protein [Candidatus Limnocylindrales bacterium]
PGAHAPDALARAASGAAPALVAPPAIDPALAAWRDSLDSPIDAFGIDLGPLLASEVATVASRWLPGMTGSIDRIERFIKRIKPAAIVLADEYHRQDWMAAARAAGIPVAAVQHGMIYPHHNGYIHAARPDSLRLPQRTFVFGRWERDLLREASVYRDDEVIVGGSPRLDLVAPDPTARARIRAELGIADDERVVLVSGTWGGLYRRFHYPIALAALMDRPLPGVHIVVKLHPGEPDEGPYRRIIEGVAAARGFTPPRITIIQSIDLYRLLAASDVHLGIHSTVLTEAVVTRTPNLLADGLAGADLLGYVPAGVALSVRDGASLLAALDAAAAGVLTEADAAAFTDAHFEPGSASERIAANLETWLR